MYDVWLAVELAVVYFLFIETGNQSLEQTAMILDGTVLEEKLADEVTQDSNQKHIIEVSTNPEFKEV